MVCGEREVRDSEGELEMKLGWFWEDEGQWKQEIPDCEVIRPEDRLKTFRLCWRKSFLSIS